MGHSLSLVPRRMAVWARPLLIGCLYEVAFFALDRLSLAFQTHPGVTIWYPPSGLSLAFLLTYGGVFWFPTILAELISNLWTYDVPASVPEIVLWSLFISALYAGVAVILRRLHLNFNLRSLRDVTLFVVAAVLTTFTLAVLAITSFAPPGPHPWQEYAMPVFQWWVGEAIGLFTVTPFMLVIVLPLLNPASAGTMPRTLAELGRYFSLRQTFVLLAEGAILVLVLWIIFRSGVELSLGLYYLAFLPLTWITLAHGMRGAVTGSLIINFGATFLNQFNGTDLDRTLPLQVFMLTLAVTALYLGAVVTQRGEAEASFRSVVEQSIQGITILQADRIVFCNRALARMLGYSIGDLTGLSLGEVAQYIYAEDRATTLSEGASILRGESQADFLEFRATHRDGSLRWLRLTASQVTYQSAPAVQVAVMDITKSRTAEEALRESEARYRALLFESAEAIYLYDARTRQILECNPAFLKLTGYTAQEACTLTVYDFVAQSPDEIEDYFNRVLSAGSPILASRTWRRKDGSLIEVEVSAGKVVRQRAPTFFVIARDVTERKRAELALYQSEQRYRALVENINDMFFVCDGDGRFVYASPNLLTNMQFEEEELGGAPYSRLVDPMDRAQVMEFYRRHTTQGTLDVTCEFRARRRDGSNFWVEQATRFVRDANGAVTEYHSVVRDISERKRAEQEIKRHADRAEALVRIAARLNTRLDLDTVLNTVCEEAAYALGVPATALRLVDLRRQEVTIASSFGLPLAFRNFKPSPLALYQELGAQHHDLFVTPEVQNLENVPNREFYAAFDIHTVATALMRRDDQLIGGLSLFTINERREFTPDELELLRGLADQAALAIVNARLFEATEQRLERLHSLRSIDTAITASVDLGFTLNRVLEQVVNQLRVDAVDILQFNEAEHVLHYAAALGFQTSAPKHVHLPLGKGYAGIAALERRTIRVPDLPEALDGLGRIPTIGQEGFQSYYVVPLLAKGQIQGVMELFSRSRLDPEEEWEEFLEALAGQAAIAIDNGRLFVNLQQSNMALRTAYDSTLEGWSRALDLRDKETQGHTQRVAENAVLLARRMGLGEEELVQIRRGALLHDIGKMGIPDGILLKGGPLTAQEWEIMRMHPVYAYEFLAPITYLRPALDIPYCHHEKWDGTGYPRGLKGELIPLSARIFALVDIVDALSSDRPYRTAWTLDRVREHIRSLAGTHLDPTVVEVYLTMP